MTPRGVIPSGRGFGSQQQSGRGSYFQQQGRGFSGRGNNFQPGRGSASNQQFRNNRNQMRTPYAQYTEAGYENEFTDAGVHMAEGTYDQGETGYDEAQAQPDVSENNAEYAQSAEEQCYEEEEQYFS